MTPEHEHAHQEATATPKPNFQHEISFDLLSSRTFDLAAIADAIGGERSEEHEISLTAEGRPFHLHKVDVVTGEERNAILTQSWNWRDAEKALDQAVDAFSIRDHSDAWSTYRDRVARFRRILAKVIRASEPMAVLCRSSQQFLEPSWLLEALEENPGDELFGFVNVRLYKVEGHERGITAEYDETIMDTLGLGALGLTDVQCHYKHLDPPMVAEILYNTAQYIYEHGPIIESGHQLHGPGEDKWICQLEDSIVDPFRLVVDVNPGRPYAAGARK